MRRGCLRITAVAMLALLNSKIANGQTDEQQFYREQFADWGGIVFRCVPDNDADNLQKRLCADASAEAGLLAAMAKIELRDLTGESDGSRISFEVRTTKSLVLEARIRSTQGTPHAVYLELEAKSFYTNAIEQDGKEGTPYIKPRAGDLVLWNKDIIGAGGTDAELAQGISAALITDLKEFFAQFIKGRN